MDKWTWCVGIAIVIGLGLWVPFVFVKAIRMGRGIATKWDPVLALTEQLFFMILVAFDLSALAVAMIAWIGAKMAAGWNRDKDDPTTKEWGSEKQWQARKTALLGSVASLTIALIAGLIVRGDIALP